MFQVANNYEEDEMAAAWNSCVRLSCLEHGMTVHTNFDLVKYE
jgi:DDB1- and CUL4-associated factor 15